MKSTPTTKKRRTQTRPTVVNTKPIIMVIGSSEENRYMLRVVLELWGYEVLEAETCDESMKLWSERHPSLILLDTTLRFMAELENIQLLKQIDRLLHVPALLMSGFSHETYRNAAFERGASAFLVRPIDFDELQHYVEAFLGAKTPKIEVNS